MNAVNNSVYEFSSLPCALVTHQPDQIRYAKKCPTRPTGCETSTDKTQSQRCSSKKSFSSLFSIRKVKLVKQKYMEACLEEGKYYLANWESAQGQENVAIPSAFIDFGDNVQPMGTLSEQMMLLSICNNTEADECPSTSSDGGKIILQNTLTDDMCDFIQTGSRQISDNIIAIYVDEMKNNAEISHLGNPLISTK